jgi:replicative DNA helicase
MAAEGVVIAASVENSRRAGYPRDTALALVKPGDFYSDDNARIWEAVTELAKSSKPVHTQSITGWLRERGITSADLFQYVHEVVVLTPAVAEVEYYALRVASLAKRRRLIAEMQRLIAEGFSAPADVDTDWCDQAVAAIEAAGGDQSTVYSGRPLLDFARSAFQAVHEKSEAIKRGE